MTPLSWVPWRAGAKSMASAFPPRMHMRCMPHVIHLVALKLFEGIGAISSGECPHASGRGGQYQDCVTGPVGREYDDEGAQGDGTILKQRLLLSIRCVVEVLFLLIPAAKHVRLDLCSWIW
ncbi:hypothetical protein HGRIS_001242 [Hohenbuehelia grisea]|uniref:Transposase n=1 Tax=Hohenbuehelia grisea TaxID=104357 RepID=A0ABR3JQK8_9AGAR